jgi:hypothetical protein
VCFLFYKKHRKGDIKMELTKEEIWALKSAIVGRVQILVDNRNKEFNKDIAFMKEKNEEEIRLLENLFKRFKEEEND